MQDESKLRQHIEYWAFDMYKKPLQGEGIVNVDVINQSIEMIIATPYTSRLFNLSFGSMFSLRLFENMTESHMTEILDELLLSIEHWEDRIEVIKNEVELIGDSNNNTVKLTIPYIIKNINMMGEFSKIIKA